MLLERRFDAVLLGAELAGIGARELCLRLRAVDSHADTPVLYLLHPSEQVQMDGFFAAGGDDFLTLPLSPQLLKTRLSGRLHRGAVNKRLAGEHEESSKAAALDVPGPGAGVMVVRSWVQHASGPDASAPALGARSVATQLGLQVECIYRHGGRVERLADGVVYALFDGPTGIFDAGQCSNAILTIGAGMTSNQEERPRVALGIVGCGSNEASGCDSGAGRAALLDAAFAAALEHCMTARAMQVMVPPELHSALGELSHVRYSQNAGVAQLVNGNMSVPVKRLKRVRGHAA